MTILSPNRNPDYHIPDIVAWQSISSDGARHMGLEADSDIRIGMESATGKVLLESHELIIRGALRKTVPLDDLNDIHVVDQELLFTHEGVAHALRLPEGHAAKWLRKITTPPPTLAHKLGVDDGHRAVVWGHIDDGELKTALHNATTTNPKHAVSAIVVARSHGELNAGVAELCQRMPEAPVWIVYPKGAASTLPESTVRSHMRAMGMVDSKSCAVSETLTATRFGARKA